jgi:hypothetical protein
MKAQTLQISIWDLATYIFLNKLKKGLKISKLFVSLKMTLYNSQSTPEKLGFERGEAVSFGH